MKIEKGKTSPGPCVDSHGRNKMASRRTTPDRAGARPYPPARVRAAFFAEADRSAAVRRRATERPCRERDCLDAVSELSLFKALMVARSLFEDGSGSSPFCARAYSRFACCRAFSGTAPFSGGGNLTPARRALERPIAMACLAERAPCLPSRICSISSRTNSPACVEGAFPSRSALRARSRVLCSGILIIRSTLGKWFLYSFRRPQHNGRADLPFARAG